ncbi:hypothetical protein D3C84_921540 [compost metagenome]
MRVPAVGVTVGDLKRTDRTENFEQPAQLTVVAVLEHFASRVTQTLHELGQHVLSGMANRQGHHLNPTTSGNMRIDRLANLDLAPFADLDRADRAVPRTAASLEARIVRLAGDLVLEDAHTTNLVG